MAKFMNSRRFKSIAVDISILCVIGVVTSIPYFASKKFELIYFYNFEMSLLYSIFFCKDIFGSQSIGKRMLKLKVINTKINKDEEKVNTLELNPIRLILRNLFVYIWPIEILLIFYQNKRLGDIIIKTKVVPFDKQVDTIKKIDVFKNLFIFLIVFAITLSFTFSALFLMNNF
jgi:uncharacterized RDD family membrane protein YckC